jgi:hypothetical protein
MSTDGQHDLEREIILSVSHKTTKTSSKFYATVKKIPVVLWYAKQGSHNQIRSPIPDGGEP